METQIVIGAEQSAECAEWRERERRIALTAQSSGLLSPYL